MSDIASRPIVVGVDGTALSRDALVFALEEAAVRGTRVRAVSAWTFGTVLADAEPGTTQEEAIQEATDALSSSLADALGRTEARPEVEQLVEHGAPGEVLVEASKGAGLLVVGSGRKGPLARTFLGSVSDHCVRHATAPVVVVTSTACL